MREETILGRSGQPLYRIEVPAKWERVGVAASEDTTLPIAEFRAGDVRFVIHNFPGKKIPPPLQVERWKGQSKPRRIEAAAFSGYRGLVFESDTVLAWALEWGATKKGEGEEMADVTLKATGPIEKLREEVLSSARTFERMSSPCEW